MKHMIEKLRKIICCTLIFTLFNTSFQPTYAFPDLDKDVDISSPSHPQETPPLEDPQADKKTRRSLKPRSINAGNEFRVNQVTTGDQDYASIAVLNQTVLVTWEDSRAGNYDIWSRFFPFNESAANPEFIVNPITSTIQTGPSVTTLRNGNLFFTWDDYQTGDYDVFGIVLDPYGVASNEFPVNRDRTGRQSYSRVKGLSDGNAAAVWLGDQKVTGIYDVYGGEFAPNGTAIGPQPQLNQNTTGTIYSPSIATSNDTLAITYDAYLLAGDSDIYVRPFSLDFSPKDNELRVNKNTTGQQRNPSIVLLKNGKYFVVWWGDQTGRSHIYGIILNSDLKTTDTESPINENMTASQGGPVLTLLPTGDVLVLWVDSQTGDYDIYGRLFSPDKAPLGPEFRVNQDTTGEQFYIAAESLPDGDVFVTWNGDQAGTRDVYGRVLDVATLSSFRYPAPSPAPVPALLPSPRPAPLPSPKSAPASVLPSASLSAPVPSPILTPSLFTQPSSDTGSLSFSEFSTYMLTPSSSSLPFSSSSTVLMDSSSSSLELSTHSPSGRTTAIIGGAVGGAALLIIAVVVAILVKVFCCSGGHKKDTPDSSPVDEEDAEEKGESGSSSLTDPDRMTLTNVTEKVTGKLSDKQRKEQYVDFSSMSTVVDEKEGKYQYVDLSLLPGGEVKANLSK
jgi:hypothetical protein